MRLLIVGDSVAEFTRNHRSFMDALGSVEEAFLAAVERYQGAQQAGNAIWAARHARTRAAMISATVMTSAGWKTFVT